MGVSSKHRCYGEFEEIWRRCRDAAAGEDAVKARDVTPAVRSTGDIVRRRERHYLPQPLGQEDADYEAYKGRAQWYGATSGTIDALIGAAFRRRPAPVLPEGMDALLADIDHMGTPFDSFVRDTLLDVMQVGRAGLMVDVPGDDAPPLERRPYLVCWKAEQIINWRSEMTPSGARLSLVVLAQTDYDVTSEDLYEETQVQRYRVLRLDDDGLYVHETYEEDAKGGVTLVAHTEPKSSAGRLDFIPFVFVNANGLGVDPVRPPLLPLVNVNMHHYVLSADLNHGLHFTALPTPWVSGGSDEQKYYIGSECGWNLPAGASVGYLEFSGSGLSAIRDEMKADEDRMVVLGARMLRSEKREAETAEALRLAQSGDQARLAVMVDTVDIAMTKALGWMAEWGRYGSSEDVQAGLSRDFIDGRLSTADAEAFMRMAQSGYLTDEDVFRLYSEGELLSSEDTEESWLAKLDEQRRRVTGAGMGVPIDNEEQGAEQA